jgi:hypothetical protein
LVHARWEAGDAVGLLAEDREIAASADERARAEILTYLALFDPSSPDRVAGARPSPSDDVLRVWRAEGRV